MSLDNYVAFYVAGDHDKLREVFQNYNQSIATIAFETSKDSHAWCNGKHIHVLAQWSDKQYRAFMAKLKSMDFPMFGRATKDQPRTYGKVKHIRDFKKMLAYTIKGNNFISTEDSELIKQCQEISFEKQDLISECREKINTYLDTSLTFTKNNHTEKWSQPQPKGYLYPTDTDYSLLPKIKLQIIHYFRENGEKMPCKSKVLYFAQYYLMYHRSDVIDEQILELFY